MTFQAKKELKAAEAPAGFSLVGVERKGRFESEAFSSFNTLTGLYP